MVAVLSGNRNFEGRINPDVKMNYLASPPLVVAYALAGTMDFDLATEPLGTGHRRQRRVPARHLADAGGGRSEVIDGVHRRRRCSPRDYADVFAGDERWPSLPTPDGRHLRLGRRLDLRPQAPVLRRHDGRADAGHRHRRAPACSPCSATRSPPTTSARPARSRRTAPAGKYLAEHGVERKDFNSYGSRRGNHEVMIRGTFANIRLRNQLLDGVEGGFTRDFTAGRRAGDRSTTPLQSYAAAGIPLVILAGKEYGSGSSRDWAAKGTALLGVQGRHRRVLRAHPPLEPDRHGRAAAAVPAGRDAALARPRRHRDLRDHRRHRAQRGRHAEDGHGHRDQGRRRRDVEFDAVLRIDTPGEADYYRNGGILQYVLRSLVAG